jgi:hypothetical protein
MARLAPLVSLAAVLLACGGSVVTIGPGDAGDGGNPACPTPAVVGASGSCNDPGLTCSGSVSVPSCNSTGSTTLVQCTCNSGVWQCPVFSGGIECPAPPPACPLPAQVQANDLCTPYPGLSCLSDIPIVGCDGQPMGYVSCTCPNGSWSCETPTPLCPVDAGGCPPPDSTFAGQGCAYYAGTCGGDPQICGGQVLYDALQCNAGVWTVVAQTACDVDGGEGPDGM